MISGSKDNLSRCTLCPALCELELAWKGPDIPRVEYPRQSGKGLCPRGAAMGELLASPSRIRKAAISGRQVPMLDAVASIAERIKDNGAIFFIDANLPLEEVVAVAETVSGWQQAELCLIGSPEDEQLILGLEASGAAYIAQEDLSQCDGFVVIGDVFATNPRCSRYVLDVLMSNRRAPMVVIDSSGSIVAKFARTLISCKPGEEIEALKSGELTAAVEPCKKLGVIVSAEPARGRIWRQLGFLAGQLAKSHGGGVAVQTAGANAIAAIRLNQQYKLTPLAEAVSPGVEKTRIAIGVDILGILDRLEVEVAVAAAAVPNETTKSAEIVLPVPLPCEMEGNFLQSGHRLTKVSALMPSPAGVPSVSELVKMIASSAGFKASAFSGKLPALEPITIDAPAALAESAGVFDDDAGSKTLTMFRQSTHHYAGTLTSQASWQGKGNSPFQVRINPADAAELGLKDLDTVRLETKSAGTVAQVQVVEHIPAGTLAVPEGYPQGRRLIRYEIDSELQAVVSYPAKVKLEKIGSFVDARGAQ